MYPIVVSGSDRRWVTADRASEKIPPAEYFTNLAKLLKDDNCLRIVYDHFMEIDIKGFIPNECRPKTDFSKDLQLRNTAWEVQYFYNLIETAISTKVVMSPTQLFQGFQHWMEKNVHNSKNCSVTSQTIGTKLKNSGIDGVSVKRTNKGSEYTINIAEASVWLEKILPKDKKEDNSDTVPTDISFPRKRMLQPNK